MILDGDCDWYKRERLHRAAAEGDLGEVARLASGGVDINAFDDWSRTPLHYAAENGHPQVVAWLLSQGAHVNAEDFANIGETALCLAVQGDKPEIVELLLKHGADPDINGWMGFTARIRAQQRKDTNGREIAALIERYRPPKPNPGGM